MKKEQSIVYLLINLAKELKNELRDEVKNEKMYIPYELLANLVGGGKTLKELSKNMRCSKQEVSRIVKRAVENNWVEISESKEDRRCKIVKFSKEGREAINIGSKNYKKIENAWREKLGVQKIDCFENILLEIINIYRKKN